MVAYWAQQVFAYGAHLNLINCVLKIILLMILPFLGLLFWLENKVSDSVEANNYDFKWKELVQISDEINNVFYEPDEDNNISACSFCGRLCDKVTRCSRCKVAIYCSNASHVMHRRFCDKYHCDDQWETPSHGFQCLLMEPENDHKYPSNEIEQRRSGGDVYYIERGEEENSVELLQHGNVNGNHDGCAVCGNPSSKKCSRCKNIKYCSRTCQHFDWRSGHKFQCLGENANSSLAAMVKNERHPQNVINPTISYEVEDTTHGSSSTLCLEFYPGNTNSKALVPSSLCQEATNNAHRKVEEQLQILKEGLAKIKDENASLRSERDQWELRTRNSIDRLYDFKKENEHQLFILKHENELISNAEKQARQMVNSLSQRLHCLQIAVENGVEEKKKQEEYIHMLQNEYAKAKIEIHEQKKCVERLTIQTTQFPMRRTEGTRQKLVNAFSEIAAVESNVVGAEVSQSISLSRNPTFTRQGCSICLTNEKNVAFGCGHMTCTDCGTKIRKCHICRKKISIRIRLYPD